MNEALEKFGIKCFLFLVCTATNVSACNIPVFRYALERWQPDDYDVVMFHDGSRSKDDDQLTGIIESSVGNTNFVWSDLSKTSSPNRDLWRSAGGQQQELLPHFVVRAPNQSTSRTISFHGPLVPNQISRLLDSPIRTELSHRLLSGHAIVWLMLRSTDETKNKTIRELITKTTESLADEIEFPEGIGLPGSELYSEVPLLMRFSVLEIQRNDPREAFLRNLFAGVENDPVVIPVFGRGRALEVIPAGRLTESLIEDLTVYLCNACSCQVKERNPGFDLLLATDWERELFGDDDPPPNRSPTGDRPPNLLSIPSGKKKIP